MTAPIAGWYPDPAGDATKLRYWDGANWTDSYMDAPAAAPQATAQTVPPTVPPQPTTAQAQQAAAQSVYQQPYVAGDVPLYYVSQQDSTLRLVAFILALVSTITIGWALIPLAWMIPMTVMTWGIYKGKRPNTVAFGVCSLIFLNMVGGILLLVSNKDE